MRSSTALLTLAFVASAVPALATPVPPALANLLAKLGRQGAAEAVAVGKEIVEKELPVFENELIGAVAGAGADELGAQAGGAALKEGAEGAAGAAAGKGAKAAGSSGGLLWKTGAVIGGAAAVADLALNLDKDGYFNIDNSSSSSAPPAAAPVSPFKLFGAAPPASTSSESAAKSSSASRFPSASPAIGPNDDPTTAPNKRTVSIDALD